MSAATHQMFGHDVKVEGRFVQWEVGRSDYNRASDPFTMGRWRWYLRTSRTDAGNTCVELFPRPSDSSQNTYPVASFSMKLLSFPPNQKVIAYRHEVDLPLKTDKDSFALTLDRFVTMRFLIEVNFLDLKIADGSDRGPLSIWPSFATKLSRHQGKRSKFARMQQEGIRTDIIINTADGSIRAHSSVLAARSPVFRSMFSHNLKEKQHSSVDISDMSIDECQAIVNYLYGDLQGKEFAAHRVALLGAAEKYDLPDLKTGCVDSLLQDIDTENLIETVQVAHIYQLPDLKARCIRLLVNFQKIYEIHDDFIEFVRTADRDLVAEVMQTVLARLAGLL